LNHNGATHAIEPGSRQTIGLVFSVSVIDRDIAALLEAHAVEALAKSSHDWRVNPIQCEEIPAEASKSLSE
jgi:hypothetical protein